MTDITKTAANAPDEDIRARNKQIIFAALAAAGIHRVSIEFDGAGDSGQIEDILVWNAAEETISLPSDRKLDLPSPFPPNPPAPITLQEAIETLAYDYLEDTHPVWEINAGAFGTFLFDVPGRSITLDYRQRFGHGTSVPSRARLGEEMGRRRLRPSAAAQLVRPVEGDRGGFPAPRAATSRRGYFHAGDSFGPTITLSSGRVIPTRYVGEQHIQQDLGFIPSFADWMRAIRPLPWMGRAGRLDDRPDHAAVQLTARETQHDQS